jgi:hypothetical protein
MAVRVKASAGPLVAFAPAPFWAGDYRSCSAAGLAEPFFLVQPIPDVAGYILGRQPGPRGYPG